VAIFVETDIAAPLAELWSRTQDPALHERWDLRFTGIAYDAPPSAGQPQAFDYETRLGFGIAVRGQGETLAERNRPDGTGLSALRFWSASRLSLIREGRGYWLYTPTERGVRFRTGYDYGTRFGLAGRIVDRFAFRPLIGWATAWSFDRLRLWLERGIDPGSSGRSAENPAAPFHRSREIHLHGFERGRQASGDTRDQHHYRHVSENAPIGQQRQIRSPGRDVAKQR